MAYLITGVGVGSRGKKHSGMEEAGQACGLGTGPRGSARPSSKSALRTGTSSPNSQHMTLVNVHNFIFAHRNREQTEGDSTFHLDESPVNVAFSELQN